MRLIDADKADVNYIICYYSDHCYLEDVQAWLDEQPTIQQPEWISCAERLPTKDDANRFEEVLAITKNTVTTYNYKWVRSDKENYYLWWMPLSALPQPPKEGE